VLVCPPGSQLEQERCGTDANGGCNSSVPQFEPITCPTTICGTVWYDGTNRDTDWYELTLTAPARVTVTGTGEINRMLFGFIKQYVAGVPGCENVTGILGSYVLAEKCTPNSVTSACLPPGTYYLFAALDMHTAADCPVHYVMTVTSEPCNAVLGDCCRYGDCLPNLTQETCSAANGTWQGALTTCDPNPCPPCVVCPAGAYQEQEACGAVVNDGCLLAAPVFEQIPYTPIDICGTAWYDRNSFTFDSDWYQLDLASPSIVTVTCAADTPDFQFGWLVQTVPGVPRCDNLTFDIYPGVFGTVCQSATFVVPCKPAGTYYLIALPGFSESAPCPAHYTMHVEITPCAR
jgi:hypothetical protein